ncbi:hypothetical protein [Dyella sp. 2RAB6]|uniref:hypothetical protein n=1 Tax=Dyella sp. 2RAB6 TaxID=3232992 RepID=UPI003F91A810
MKRKTPVVLATALLACISLQAAARTPPRYTVVELGSLGGASSQGNSINRFGLISGFSVLSDGRTHATFWLHHAAHDMGTLGGANSQVVWPVKNALGVLSGIAQTATPDPRGEAWSCSAFIPSTGTTCWGFVWAFGKMHGLPPLPGGNNSFATGTNDFLQTAGWAETGIPDPSCNPKSHQVLQFLPVVWSDAGKHVRRLPLLYGDTSGAATALNDHGQIVGISGICDQAAGRYTAAHMVLWENGHATDIGTIGGDAWNTPMAINENGVVVGFANVVPGAALKEHAFLWRKGSPPRDLGTLHANDVHSQALGINNLAQAVGVSCTAGFASCRGFLYEDGVMTDLNDLAPDYPGVVVDAQDINDQGVITGQAVTANGEAVAFRAYPAGTSPGP